MTDRLVLKVEEAAKMLGISRTKAYELVKQGVIPSMKIGEVKRIRIADLEAFVREGSRTEVPTAVDADRETV